MERQLLFRRLSIVVFLIGIVICASAHPTTLNLQVTQQTEGTDSVWRRTLIVTTIEGETEEFVLERNTRIGTIGAFFEIVSDGLSTYFMLDEVKQFSYGKKRVLSGIESPKTEALSESTPFILTDDGELRLSNVKEGSLITVYNLDGRQLYNHRATKAGPLTLSLSALQTGVYIMRIDRRTYKIQK